MPRFVILEHDHPTLHWDLMLEAGGALRTWRLREAPAAGKTVAAEASIDHRPFYLDYEGPVSGNRGNVRRWDAGTYEILAESPDSLTVSLAGGQRHGVGQLLHLDGTRWQFTLDATAAPPPPPWG